MAASREISLLHIRLGAPVSTNHWEIGVPDGESALALRACLVGWGLLEKRVGERTAGTLDDRTDIRIRTPR